MSFREIPNLSREVDGVTPLLSLCYRYSFVPFYCCALYLVHYNCTFVICNLVKLRLRGLVHATRMNMLLVCRQVWHWRLVRDLRLHRYGECSHQLVSSRLGKSAALLFYPIVNKSMCQPRPINRCRRDSIYVAILFTSFGFLPVNVRITHFQSRPPNHFKNNSPNRVIRVSLPSTTFCITSTV